MITSRKVRRAGNSLVVSIPNEVLEALDIKEGNNVQFNIKDNQVYLEKEVNEQERFYKLLEETMNDYHEALERIGAQ
ncbi:AbrB/MazE/SpoVT family DNA-binding domain-containing protein [Staphylococcus hominis]|uniref:AbrB/MazE/SpoVT family DNA-binding domain-containing protein n=1 Tax=Staphylococcus hominis TaxID=1290 RepID=UPI002878E937|nr:AbrB/MazE/SpoVT family DNA-binding domain-containing protein [Staphylococcus hominis]MDS3884563.1 AbrB/MazE/SpoVT family DNA-binding domain-containing protein [Staphylococcus hominis]MDS3884709.1 AbrB/MazE/SpoVT family DNA-binding domain-containing protein [Staphylococcus hominis]